MRGEQLTETSAAHRPGGRLARAVLGARARHPRAGPIALCSLAAAFPLVQQDPFRLRILTVGWLLASLAIGAGFTLARAGLFNMSQGTLHGIGAYATFNSVDRFGFPFELAVVVAAVAGGLAGALLALTSLRVRNDLWALMSMAFTVGMIDLFKNLEPVTNGKDGAGISFQSFAGVAIDSPTRFYYAALGVLVLSMVVIGQIGRTPMGLGFLASASDERMAAMLGVSTNLARIGTLVVSGALAGIAGAFLLATTLFVTPGSFDFLRSFDLVLFAIVGGVLSMTGTAAVAAALVYVTEAFRSVTEYRLGIYGIALLGAIGLRSGAAGRLLRRRRADA